MICVGRDWAESHHDIVVLAETGEQLAELRVGDTLAGVEQIHAVVAPHIAAPAEVVVGTESVHGLVVQALVAAGYTVYEINPKASSRYRDRHHLSGAKSDRGDAKMLADVVRTDRHNHRPYIGNSDLAGHQGAGASAPVLDQPTPGAPQPAADHAALVLPGAAGGLPRACRAVGSGLPGRAGAGRASANAGPRQAAVAGTDRRRVAQSRAAARHRPTRRTHPPSAPKPAPGRACARHRGLRQGRPSLGAGDHGPDQQIEALSQALNARFEQHPDATIMR